MPRAAIRLLQAMAGADHGGAEAFFERLTLAFQAAGLTQTVLIRRNPARAERLRQGGVKVIELPFGGRLDLKTRRGFRKAIHTFQPTHVLTWMNRATGFCPRLQGIPHLARLGGYYNLKYYQRCDVLIGNTPDLVRYFQENDWPAAQTACVPNFAADPAPAPLPDGLRPTPGRKLLFAMGRLHPNKGFETLLRALHQVPDADVWLAGEGPLREDLQRLAAPLGGRVRFLGWQQNVTPFLLAADIFVCPSRHEPLGNVILEAWAHGVPVVATASEGPRQLITPEQNGLLTPIDDTQTLAAAIRRMLDDADLRQRCAAGGQTQHTELFSEAAIVRQYLHLFQTTIQTIS